MLQGMDPTKEELVWGARAIARIICSSERHTYDVLNQGRLPGAVKVSGRWCLVMSVFLDEMRRRAAEREARAAA
jgi:hypothetical protein